MSTPSVSSMVEVDAYTTPRCRLVCWQVTWLFLNTLAVAILGYGAFLFYKRDHLSCPIPTSFSRHHFPENPIVMYSSFCNQSTVPVSETLLNVSFWCNQLGCIGPYNQMCLLYVTGSAESPCAALSNTSSGGCALSCIHSVHADYLAGIILIVLALLIFVITTVVFIYKWSKTGDLC